MCFEISWLLTVECSHTPVIFVYVYDIESDEPLSILTTESFEDGTFVLNHVSPMNPFTWGGIHSGVLQHPMS